MNHQVLETLYGQLVSQLAVGLVSQRHYTSSEALVKEAVELADEVSKQTLAAMIRYQDSLPRPLIEWMPEAGDEMRSGATWKVDEEKALVAEYILKHPPEQIAGYHRRTHGSILGRLVHLGRLRFTPTQGYVDTETGMRYA